MENIETKKETRIGITNRNLLGSVAKCAVMQSPYHRPDNLEIVLDKLNELTKEDFPGYVQFFETWKEAKEYLQGKLSQIPEFMAWNERKNGRQGMGFSGAGHHDDGSITMFTAKADDDFIDLDALYRNVINEIINS